MQTPAQLFFPSNAFMASARSLHTFNRGKQLNCSLHAGLSPCRKPQKCRYAVQKLFQQEKKRTRKQTKNNTAKTGKTHNQNQNQTKTTERSGIATSNGNYMHDDILCVILRMAQNKKQNRTNTKHTNGPRWWVRANASSAQSFRSDATQRRHTRGTPAQTSEFPKVRY